MAICSRVAPVLATIALFAAGCGSSAAHTNSKPASTAAPAQPGGAGFAWLRPAAPPSGWTTVRISSGATLAYPPQWRRSVSDAGTATAELRDRRGGFLGYLNLTPRQGAETLANWSSFRITHNEAEGDRHVTRLAAAGGLRFRSGTGSCVRDSYLTKTGAHFIELACIVAGSRTTSVIVGAAPPQAWTSKAPQIERAISAFTT